MVQEKKARIFEYIVSRIAQGIAPTVREIGRDCGIKSTSTVQKYIELLCEDGLLVKEDGHNRTLRLPNQTATQVPVLGNVAAGTPITAIDDIQGYLPFPGTYEPGELFALTVQGDSMIDIGMFEGDIVVVRRCDTAEDGDLVVALVEDSATVKRFFREEAQVRLQPENASYEPIYAREVRILGKVLACIHYYDR